MKNEFIELVSLWTRFPCGAWLMKSCFIRYLVAYGFAWSDIWLRLHSCLLIRSCSESYVGYKAKFLGFDHEKRVLSGFFDHEKRVHWTCFSLNSFSLWCLINEVLLDQKFGCLWVCLIRYLAASALVFSYMENKFNQLVIWSSKPRELR